MRLLHRCILTSAVLAAGALVPVATAGAQPIGAQSQLSAFGAGDPGDGALEPQVAHGTSASLVVWSEQEVIDVDRGGGSFERVAGRFVNGEGAPTAPTFTIFDGIVTSGPAVAYSATSDVFLVVWRSAGKGAFILGRRYRGDGTAIDTDPFIVALTEGPTDRVRVEWSPAVNQFLVVWDEDFGVFGVRVLPAGAAPDEVVLDDESPMELSEGVRDMRTADVGNDGDDWLVVFDGSEARPEARGTFDNFIWATLVGAATGEPGSPTPISSPDTANVFPAVAGNTVQGGFGVVWQSAGTIGRGIAIIGGEVVGRLVTSAGAPTGDEVIVSLPDDDMETTGPEIAFNKDANEYLVAWTQIAFLTLRQQLPTAQVYGRRLSSVLGGLTDVLQISIAGEPPRDGGTPAAAYNTSSCTYVTPYVRGTAFGSVRGNAGGFVPPNVFARGFDAPDCPTPGSPPAAVAQQAQQLGTALPRTCASRRNFTIRLVRRKGRVYRSARIRVNGKLVKVVFGRRVTAPVDLRGLPRGTFTVSIEVRLANGRRMKGARRYRTCEKKLPPSNGLDRPDAL